MVHELAHAVAAKRCGVTAARIDLYIFGGVVAFDTPPRTMWNDFAIVIAGPLSNLALAAMAYTLLIVLNGGLPDLITHGPLRSDVIFEPRITERALTFAVYLNLGLFVVNMLPAFPLDGGKLLYLLIARRWDRRTATLVVAKLGVMLAFASYILLLVTAVVGCPIWSPLAPGSTSKRCWPLSATAFPTTEFGRNLLTLSWWPRGKKQRGAVHFRALQAEPLK